MKVSFIIPLYNGLPLTRAMLASLQETMPVGTVHEIILVDDGSTDGTREWLASLRAPCHVLLNKENRGFAGTCNRGAAVAKGEFLFFLNNDLVLLPGWLKPMLTAFLRFRGVGVVGNVQRNFLTGAVDHAGVFFNHKGKPQHSTTRGLAAYRRVAAVTGACFGITRGAWHQLGGFDEGFVNGCEDVDLCLRARAAGLTNYVALRSTVRHHISASLGRKLRDEHNTCRLVHRWRGEIAPLAARDWCRHFIATHWEDSSIYDDDLARDALSCWLGATPSPLILRGVQSALQREIVRWRELLRPANHPEDPASSSNAQPIAPPIGVGG